MKNLLLSGLGGSLFPFLNDSLNKKYRLFYVDSNHALLKVYPDLNFFPAPSVLSKEYFPFIEEIVRTHKIDVYIPLIDEEILPALEYSSENNKDICILAPCPEFVRLCLDKHLLMGALDKAKISTLQSYLATAVPTDLQYPLFMKPRQSRGSRGIFKIKSKRQLEAYLTLNDHYKPNEIMVQNFVTGQEYTVGVLTNNKNNLLTICSKKVILKKGITISAVTENNLLINSVIEKIVDYFKPKGPFNAQLFITPDNEVKIFEINPRFSTTTILSMKAGVDKISLYLEYFNNTFTQPVIFPKENIYLYRRWDSVFYE